MKKLLGILLVVALSWWAVRSLFIPGYFPMHDDTQVARVVEMGRALREGQFPVRWVSDLGYGYGYPLFNFYGPLPYYVGGIFYAAGMTGLAATKLMMGLGIILSGIAMFLVIGDIAGGIAGVIAAVFYVYAPYHAVDIYVRGAVGEYWAFIFLPLVFWGFWKKNYLAGAVGMAGIILSHTVLGYASMLFIGLALLAVRLRREAVILVLLGLGLSAFFWLPALAEMKFTNVASVIGSTADYRDHFVCPGELWNSPWGYGGSAPGCLDGLSFKIGKEFLIFALLAAAGIFLYVKNRTARILAAVNIGIFGVSVFLMLPVSAFVWSSIPLFAYLQYPWRFLTFTALSLSMLVAGMVYLTRSRLLRWAIAAAGIAALLFIEAKYFVPQYTYGRPASAFETDGEIRYRVSGISDEYLPPGIEKPASEQSVVRDIIAQSDAYTVGIIQNSDTYKKFEFRSGTDNRIRINTAYFPGWIYRVNDTYVQPQLDHGLPVLTVPSGFTVVQMWFTNTPVRTVGNAVSIVSVLVWIYLYDKRKKAVR